MVKNLTPLDRIVLIGLVLVMIYMLIDEAYTRYTINQCYKVSVATLTRTYYKKSGKFGTLQFRYKRQLITKEYASINDNNRYFIGKRYYVKISCHNDSMSRIDWDTPVPESLALSPANGWPPQVVYPR